MIWSLIVGGCIGAIAGAITKRGGSMGIIANIAAGLIGSSVGEFLFDDFGPEIADMSIIPSIIGACLVILLVSALLGREK